MREHPSLKHMTIGMERSALDFGMAPKSRKTDAFVALCREALLEKAGKSRAARNEVDAFLTEAILAGYFSDAPDANSYADEEDAEADFDNWRADRRKAKRGRG